MHSTVDVLAANREDADVVRFVQPRPAATESRVQGVRMGSWQRLLCRDSEDDINAFKIQGRFPLENYSRSFAQHTGFPSFLLCLHDTHLH